MDFFDPAFQSGPFTQERFGLCDDQDTTPAYVDVVSPDKWVATVENPARREVIFTAVDKGVIQDHEAEGRGRCDAMLTLDELLYLAELKDRGSSSWRADAIEQLKSTIEFLRQHHDLTHFAIRRPLPVIKSARAFNRLITRKDCDFFARMVFASIYRRRSSFPSNPRSNFLDWVLILVRKFGRLGYLNHSKSMS